MNRVTYRKSYADYEFYTVVVDGTAISVTVTASASVVRDWLYATLYFRRHFVYLNRLVVGLGVQWTPGGTDPPPDTVQLCVGRRCLIFQLARANSVPSKLRTFLLNPSHTFVGFWNHSDRRKIERCEFKLEMAKNPLDLKTCAEPDDDDDVDLTKASMKEIVEKCLGFEVEQKKEISMSVWCDEDLSNEQVTYATVDAYCAFLIGRKIRAWEINVDFYVKVDPYTIHGWVVIGYVPKHVNLRRYGKVFLENEKMASSTYTRRG